ncbi:MAG: F0F1 ATP synthase subunit B [Acidimicrobiales bacterium]|nr:F0F1 ATP synthase subunit B [Acidimicrobiales bacterium]
MQRIRMALLAAGVVAMAMFAFASPSSAEGETELRHDVHECIEQLEAANSIDVDCQAAPNPMVPETNEVIWGTVGFVIVFGAIAFFGYPQIKKAMNARTERIASDLAAADSQKAEADRLVADYQAKLADARNESARIIEEARQTADGVRRQLEAKAQADIAEMRAQAAADIEAAKSQALADLRGEVTSLAIGAAEQVVQRNLNDDTNRALVEAYIDQVGASN